MKDPRFVFFYWFVGDVCHVPEGMMLPWWGRLIFTVLFPVRSIRWWVQSREGFEMEYLAWRIHGVRFCSRDLHWLAYVPNGTVIRVIREDDSTWIKFEEVRNDDDIHRK